MTTGTGMTIGVRMLPGLIDTLDRWIEKQKGLEMSRPEAIRHLVELGLTVKRAAKQPSHAGAHRAKELAAQAIDKLSDPTAHPVERAHRRHKLTKGPEEFRNVRVDRTKAKGK